LGLGAAAGVGAIAVASQLKPWQVLVSISTPSVAQRLAGLFGDRSSASIVGRAYLDTAPEHASVARLVDDVVAGLPAGRDTVRDAKQDELRDLLAARIRADFEEDRIVDVDGWILSPTEARLFALATLV
jgi:hypothetical protein